MPRAARKAGFITLVVPADSRQLPDTVPGVYRPGGAGGHPRVAPCAVGFAGGAATARLDWRPIPSRQTETVACSAFFLLMRLEKGTIV